LSTVLTIQKYLLNIDMIDIFLTYRSKKCTAVNPLPFQQHIYEVLLL